MEAEKTVEEFGAQLNFTHRATLGGGDDADESQGDMGHLAKE